MGNACSKSQIHQDFIAEFTKRPIYSLDVRTWWISWWWKNMDQVEPHGAITEITRGWPPKPHRLLRSHHQQPPGILCENRSFSHRKNGSKIYGTVYIYIYMVYVYIYILSWYIWYIILMILFSSFFQTRHGTTSINYRLTFWCFLRTLAGAPTVQLRTGQPRAPQDATEQVDDDGEIFDDLVQKFKSHQ